MEYLPVMSPETIQKFHFEFIIISATPAPALAPPAPFEGDDGSVIYPFINNNNYYLSHPVRHGNAPIPSAESSRQLRLGIRQSYRCPLLHGGEWLENSLLSLSESFLWKMCICQGNLIRSTGQEFSLIKHLIGHSRRNLELVSQTFISCLGISEESNTIQSPILWLYPIDWWEFLVQLQNIINLIGNPS